MKSAKACRASPKVCRKEFGVPARIANVEKHPGVDVYFQRRDFASLTGDVCLIPIE